MSPCRIHSSVETSVNGLSNLSTIHMVTLNWHVKEILQSAHWIIRRCNGNGLRSSLPLQPEEVWRRAVSADAGCWRPLAALLTAADGDEPPAARPGLPGDGAARPGLPGDSRALADAACRALPCPLLSELAVLRPPFARRYTAHLQRYAARMQYDAGSGRWLHPDSPEQDWEKLLQHFAGLLQGPPATRESTLRTLNSFKAADGDFEVWGISVWTDLLLALKQQKVV